MSTLSIAELEAQVETDLSDSALQRIIDAAEREIKEYVGPSSAMVYEIDATDDPVFRLPVPASAITSIVEYTSAQSEPTKTTLAADDYELSDDGWWVRRLSSGTNARDAWSWHVVVTFTPAADVDRRKQAAIKLARLSIVHSGYSQERIGDWSATTADMRKERARILRTLDGSLID